MSLVERGDEWVIKSFCLVRDVYMVVLSSALKKRCRTTLLKYDEFTTHTKLRGVFNVAGLYPYRMQLPIYAEQYSSIKDRVEATMNFLLELDQDTHEGKSIFLTFLEELRNLQIPTSSLYADLDSLCHDIEELDCHSDSTKSTREDGHIVVPADSPDADLHRTRFNYYLHAFIEEYDKIPRWLREEADKPFSEHFFIQPELTKWSQSVLQNLPDREPQHIKEILEQDQRQQFPGDLLNYISLFNEVWQKKTTHWVITGEPGIGKTTLLKMLGVQLAKALLNDDSPTQQIPVFVELAEYARELEHRDRTTIVADHTAFQEYICTLPLLEDAFPTIKREDVESGLKNGKYLLLLDALDEIGSPQLRSRISRDIADMLKRCKCTIIITSRATIFEQYQEIDCTAKEILPLTKEQIETCIDRQFSSDEEDKALLLREKLNNNIRLQTMLSNPMLLYMMLKKFKYKARYQDITIPEHRIALYSEFVIHLLEERPQQRHKYDSQSASQISSDLVECYLTNIARTMHNWGVWYAEEVNVLAAMKEIVSIDDNITKKHLKYIVEEIGILQKIDRGEYAFCHFTFQEFFTGKYLVNLEQKYIDEFIDNKEKQPYRLTDPWWCEVIVTYYVLSTRPDREWLLRKFLDTDEETIFATRTLLAVDCLRNENLKVTEVSPFYYQVHNLLKERYYRDPQLGNTMFQAIRNLGGPSLLGFLEQELSQTDEERCKRAIEMLRQLSENKKEAFELLVSKYEKDGGYPSNLIWNAANAIVTLNKEKAKPLILEWLYGRKTLTQSIVSEMVATNEEDHLSLLLDWADDPETPEDMQEIISQQLGHIGYKNSVYPKVCAFLLKRLKTAQSQIERADILKSISFPADDPMKEYVRSLLSVQETDLIEAAVRFVGEQQDIQAIEQLVGLLLDCTQEAILVETVKSLGKMNNPEAEDYLSMYLDDHPSESLWRERIKILGDYSGKEGFLTLVKLLQHPVRSNLNSHEIKSEIVKALYKVCERHFIQKTDEASYSWCQQILDHLQVASDEGNSVYNAAVYIILQLAQKKHIKQLFTLASLQDALGNAIINYLAKPNCRERLQELAIDPHLAESIDTFLQHYKKYRENDAITAEVFLRIELIKGQTQLQQVLISTSAMKCLAAIKIAQEEFNHNDRELLSAFQHLLGYSDPRVVKKAILFLADFGGGEVVDDLLYVFRTNPDHRQEAFEALFTIAQRERILGIKPFLRGLNNG